MPTIPKQGTEFLVNSQKTGDQGSPSITGLKNGGFVATWSTTDGAQDGSGNAVKAQVYNAAGAKVGGEFLVNSQVLANQDSASVATLAGGGFVIIWGDAGSGGYPKPTGNVKAQIYSATGVKVGGELTLATGTPATNVVGLANGGFAVTYGWHSSAIFSFSTGVDVAIFDSAGNPVGSAFTVTSSSSAFKSVNGPTITGLANGRFVVAWHLNDASASNNAIVGQIYEANGTPVGTTLALSTSQNVDAPSISGLVGGGFVATWVSYDTTKDGSGSAILGQVFDANGAKVGSEFRINTKGDSEQTWPTVSSLSGGGFAVAWMSYDTTQDGSGTAIKSQVFDAKGVKIGTEMLVETKVTENQELPTIAGLGDGGFVVGWQTRDTTQDGSGTAIKAQIYDLVTTTENHAPVIGSNGGGATAAITIKENASTVTVVKAIDPDAGTTIGYAISGGADAALFKIDTKTGALAFKVAPDFETPKDVGKNNVYDVIVRASDGKQFDEQAIAVTVSNIVNKNYGGTTGNDSYKAATADEWTLNGQTGSDTLTGNGSNDIIRGGDGNDTLLGAAGDDQIFGGTGKDTLTGGAGLDAFVFDTAPIAGNEDVITDFVAVDDTIRLKKTIFAAIGPTLDATELKIGKVASDSNDFLIYNANTGQLYYDADGNGAGAQILIATLTGHPTITVADFLLY